jgi:hypothetical protein
MLMALFTHGTAIVPFSRPSVAVDGNPVALEV